MIDKLLPNAACINLIDWDSNLWDICTDTFDSLPDGGVDYFGTISWLLDTPKDFKITMTKRKTVSDIINAIRETYVTALENPIEEEYYPFDLIITNLEVDTESHRINVKFLGQ